jgi:hypothetical protein
VQKEIRNTFGTELKRLVNVKDKSELSDCYKVVFRIPKREIWNTARKLILIEGVLDVDPDLNTTLDPEFRKIFKKEARALAQVKKRPDPKWFHDNMNFKKAMKYVKDEFKENRGVFNPKTTRIRIAQFDTGYTDHPDIEFIDKKEGFNFIAGLVRRILFPRWRSDARDKLRNFRPFLWASHGTATASTIIGSRVRNTRAIYGPLKDRVDGVMPNNVDLIPFRISENIISFNNKWSMQLTR